MQIDDYTDTSPEERKQFQLLYFLFRLAFASGNVTYLQLLTSVLFLLNAFVLQVFIHFFCLSFLYHNRKNKKQQPISQLISGFYLY